MTGRMALITGGESGIGLATARRFVANGAAVHLAGLDADRLHAAAADLGAAATVSVTDVRDGAQVHAAVHTAAQRLGRLDVVFSNAGISGPVTPLVDYPEEAFRQVVDVHVLGAFHLLRQAVPLMRPGGSIVINSSVVGLRADAGIAGYATAKHAQVGLMRVAAKECAPLGIRVNTIHPGPTDTAFQRAIEVAATGADPVTAAGVFNGMIPLGRHAGVEEIAAVVLFLAGPDSTFITGATIPVDGGMSS